jgi:murein DD-endopeptidase MepM/ murein hydrolase activator NlpD
MFIMALVIILAGCFLVNKQGKVIKEQAKVIIDHEFTELRLNLDNTEMRRIIDLKTVTLDDNEYYMPVDNPVITDGLGRRISPITGLKSIHYGSDMYSNATMNVYAVKDGMVVNHYPAGDGFFHGHDIFGSLIEIRHDNGISRYGHMKETFVREDQIVKAGDLIGIIGAEGLSVGKHLHFSYLLDIFTGI